MARKCYISFKTEDAAYKKYIQDSLHIEIVDHSLDEAIDSTDEDYIMRRIREDYLSTSTVTILLIGSYGAESRGAYEQRFIKRELQASLYHGLGNTQNGILGIVLPSMYNSVFKGTSVCSTCGGNHTIVKINDDTTIKEFSYNYYIPNNKCAWSEEDRYCVLCRWDEFDANHDAYIERAFSKRSDPISEKTKVRP